MSVFDINGNDLVSLEGLTPEKYGAKGDGSTDDTQAINDAFTASALLNKPVVFGYGKTYAVSSTINMTKRQDVYGNGSVIKAVAAMDKVLNINTESQHVTSSVGKGLLTNITIDCNNLANTGIYVTYSAGFAYQNIDVIRPITNGFYFAAGFEHFCNNCRVARGGENSVGFNINTPDSHFTDIVTVNVKIGVKTTKTNFFDHVHCWNTDAAIVPQSIMFDVSNDVIATNCYCDCCAIFANFNANTFFHINGLWVLSANAFMPSSIMSGITPYLFKVGSSGNTARIKGYGIVYKSDLQYSFSDKSASEWSGFDWRANNDTTLSNMAQVPN